MEIEFLQCFSRDEMPDKLKKRLAIDPDRP